MLYITVYEDMYIIWKDITAIAPPKKIFPCLKAGI